MVEQPLALVEPLSDLRIGVKLLRVSFLPPMLRWRTVERSRRLISGVRSEVDLEVVVRSDLA